MPVNLRKTQDRCRDSARCCDLFLWELLRTVYASKPWTPHMQYVQWCWNVPKCTLSTLFSLDWKDIQQRPVGHPDRPWNVRKRKRRHRWVKSTTVLCEFSSAHVLTVTHDTTLLPGALAPYGIWWQENADFLQQQINQKANGPCTDPENSGWSIPNYIVVFPSFFLKIKIIVLISMLLLTDEIPWSLKDLITSGCCRIEGWTCDIRSEGCGKTAWIVDDYLDGSRWTNFKSRRA